MIIVRLHRSRYSPVKWIASIREVHPFTFCLRFLKPLRAISPHNRGCQQASNMRKTFVSSLTFLLLSAAAHAADVSGYAQTTLQTNATDPDLVNPWGVSFSATSPFWVSDNNSGVSTLYNTAGVKQGLTVSMPAGSFDVTGQVFNGTTNFNGDNFLFATEDGTITGWRGALGTTAETLFTETGADFNGLAISTSKTTIYAADFATGKLDVFNSSGLVGSFSNPAVPAGYVPFNVQNINGQIYVTFAPQGSGGNPVHGAGNGYVAIFNPTSNTFATFISGGVLNDPWGITIAPATGFGALSGDLLVGNFGDGTINAFNPTTGTFIGTLADISGNPIIDHGLWALDFGNGGSGGLTDSLYITAGPNGGNGGLFAQIDAVPEPSTVLLSAAGIAALVWRRRTLLRGKLA